MTLHSETHQGAAHNRRSNRVNPKELLMRLSAQYSDRETVFEKWCRAVERNEELQRSVNQYFFVNNYETHRRKQIRQSPVLTEQQRERVFEQVKERVAKIGLMYLPLPNGRAWKDSTFEQCGRAKGIFGEVEGMGRPEQRVGEVLTEKDLQQIVAKYWRNGAGKAGGL